LSDKINLQGETKMKWFTNLNVTEIKKAYHKLVMEWHPDRKMNQGADVISEATQMMQAINSAYHAALEAFNGKKYDVNRDGKTEQWTYYYNAKKEQAVIDKLDELVGLKLSDGAEIWLVGTWIWVVDTDKKIDRPLMKKTKMRWHPKRQAWYWRQAKNSAATFNSKRSLSGLANDYGLEIHKAQKRDEEESQARKPQPALVG